MESGNTEDDDESADKDYDYFSTETGVILEEEEEYDVFNNETFGEPLPGRFSFSFSSITITVNVNLEFWCFR